MKNYIEQGKNCPETDNERVELSSLVGKKITSLYYDHARKQLYFNTTRGKTFLIVDVEHVYDSNGNYFYDDME